MRTTLALICLFLILGMGSIVLAAPAANCEQYCDYPENFDPPSDRACLCNPWRAPDLETLIADVIKFIFLVATAVMPVLIIAGAFMYMTSGGNPEKLKRASSLIMYTVAGYVIILFSRAFVYIIKEIIGAP